MWLLICTANPRSNESETKSQTRNVRPAVDLFPAVSICTYSPGTFDRLFVSRFQEYIDMMLKRPHRVSTDLLIMRNNVCRVQLIQLVLPTIGCTVCLSQISDH